MANTFQIKRSPTAGNVPQLAAGELGANLPDNTLYVGQDDYTKLLIHGGGIDTNGSGTQTFTDSSPSGHTIVVTNDTQWDDTQSKFASTSIKFDGSSDLLTVANHADWDFGTADFTVDFWTYIVNGAQDDTFFSTLPTGGSPVGLNLSLRETEPFSLGVYTSVGYLGNGSVGNYTSKVIYENRWYHIALVRASGVFKFYVDGVNVGTVSGQTSLNVDTDQILHLGRFYTNTSGYHLDGFMEEFRISKGIARWTAAFTPPTRRYGVMSPEPTGDHLPLTGGTLTGNLTVEGNIQIPYGGMLSTPHNAQRGIVLSGDSNNDFWSGYGDKIFSAYNGSAYAENFRIAASGALTGATAAFNNATSGSGNRATPLDVLAVKSENTTHTVYDGFGQGITFNGVTYNNSTDRVLGRILHQLNDNSITTTRGTSLSFQTLDDATTANAPTTKLKINYDGSATFSGTATATKFRATSQIVSADNMYVAAGQFYLGAENGTTDDTYRMYGYSAGKFILESRESGNWVSRLTIDTSGNSTFGGSITATGITIGSNDVATESYCDTYTDQAIAQLVDSSPSTLNTLNELAAALGDDANYAATITTALGTKLPLAGGTLTGALTGTTITTSDKIHVNSTASSSTVTRGLELQNPTNHGDGGGTEIHAWMSNYDLGTIRFVKSVGAGASDSYTYPRVVIGAGNDVGRTQTATADPIEPLRIIQGGSVHTYQNTYIEGTAYAEGLGLELCHNRQFHTGDLTGWTDGDNKWSVTGSGTAAAPYQATPSGEGGLVMNSIGVTGSTSYLVSFRVTGRTTGSLGLRVGDSINGSAYTWYSGNGTNTATLTTGSGSQDNFILYPLSGWDGKVDNVSVRKVNTTSLQVNRGNARLDGTLSVGTSSPGAYKAYIAGNTFVGGNVIASGTVQGYLGNFTGALTGTTAAFSFAAGNHTTGLSVTNTQNGGYGTALTFSSKRTDESTPVIASRIRTEGASSWNSDASTSTNLKFETVSANTLATRMTISHNGAVDITGALTAGGNITTGGQIFTPSGSNLALNPNTGLVTVGGALQATGALSGTTGTFSGALTVDGVITNSESKSVSLSGFASNYKHTFYVDGDSDKFYKVSIHANWAQEIIIWRNYNETIDGQSSDWNNNNATHFGAMTLHATLQSDEWGGHQKMLTGWLAQNYTNIVGRVEMGGGAEYTKLNIWLRGGAGGSGAGAKYFYTVRGGYEHAGATAVTVDYNSSLNSADSFVSFVNDVRYINPHGRKYFELETTSNINCGGALTAGGNIELSHASTPHFQIQQTSGNQNKWRWYSDGTDSYIRNATGGWNVAKFTANADVGFYNSDGSATPFLWDASAESLTIGGLTVGGSIQYSGDQLVLDSSGRIDLSADDNGEVRLWDGDSKYGQFKDDDDRFRIQSMIADKAMMFVGNDNGSEITALSLDMANAGAAAFNSTVRVKAPAYGGGTGGVANIDLRTTTALTGTYGSGTAFSKKYLLQVLMPGDATQNDTNSQLIRFQLPGGYAHFACGGSGTIKITYMQSHYGGVASFEYKFAQLKGDGTNGYATKNWGDWKIQKTNQILETSSYFTQTQINYVVANLKFERFRPHTNGGSSADISALLIKLPNSGTLRVRDIVVEVNFTGANNWESNIALEDMGRYGANVPDSSDLTTITPVELWVGNTAETISTSSAITVGGAATFDSTVAITGALSPLGSTNYNDNCMAKFGNGNDMQIFHDGSNTLIRQDGTGALHIKANSLELQQANGTKFFAAASSSWAKLYHAGSEKLATTSAGVDVTGALTATGVITGAIIDGKVRGVASSANGTKFLELEHSMSADPSYYKLLLPQDYNSAGNGGHVKLTVIWHAAHASSSHTQVVEFTYGTQHTRGDDGYLEVSPVAHTHASDGADSYGGYPVVPTLKLYRGVVEDGNGDCGVLIKVGGKYSYNTDRTLRAEITGKNSDGGNSLTYFGTSNETGAVALIERTNIGGWDGDQTGRYVGIGTGSRNQWGANYVADMPLTVVTQEGDKGINLKNSSGVELIHMRQEAGDAAMIILRDGGNAKNLFTSRPSNDSYFNTDSAGLAIGATSASSHKLYVNGTSYLGGNVSLAVTGQFPAGLLVSGSHAAHGPVVQVANTVTDGNAWNMISNGSGNTSGVGHLQFWNSTDSRWNLILDGDSSDAWFNGKVCIGGTDPDYPLTVKFDGAVSYNGATDLNGESIMSLEGTNADQEAVMIRWANNGNMNNYFGVVQEGASAQGDFVWTSYGGSSLHYAERMRLTAGGHLGIGCSPDSNLHIKPASGNARLKLESDHGAADVEMMLDSAGPTRNAHITFYNGGTQKGGVGYVASDTCIKMWGDNNPADDHFCLKAGTGHIGINTAAPGDWRLYVNGDTLLKGDVEVDSALEVGGTTTLSGTLTGGTATFGGFLTASVGFQSTASAFFNGTVDVAMTGANTNLRINGAAHTGETWDGAIHIKNSGNIGNETADEAVIYAEGGELKCMDDGRNRTTLSSHIDGKWVYKSNNTKTGKSVEIHMEDLVKAVEEHLGMSFSEIIEGNA